jgi:hypothetical protein
MLDLCTLGYAWSCHHGLDNLKEFDDIDAALAASISCSERLQLADFFLASLLLRAISRNSR